MADNAFPDNAIYDKAIYENAIYIERLSKYYRLYQKPTDRIIESFHPLRKIYHKKFYAVKDLSLVIPKGQTVGIVGTNGSGKSTLLKMIAGVITPSSGQITVNGKISALLELGTGFNPEFTGLENIYYNGTINGYTRQDVEKKLDDILSFADIGDFINQPVKTYSSGMFARLAFSVATSIDPDILIVDEILSVGDIRFQQKSFRRIKNFQENGKSIIIVTHDPATILNHCNIVYWMHLGHLKLTGYADSIIKKYMAFLGYGLETQESHSIKSIKLSDYPEYIFDAKGEKYLSIDEAVLDLDEKNIVKSIIIRGWLVLPKIAPEKYNISLLMKNKNGIKNKIDAKKEIDAINDKNDQVNNVAEIITFVCQRTKRSDVADHFGDENINFCGFDLIFNSENQPLTEKISLTDNSEIIILLDFIETGKKAKISTGYFIATNIKEKNQTLRNITERNPEQYNKKNIKPGVSKNEIKKEEINQEEISKEESKNREIYKNEFRSKSHETTELQKNDNIFVNVDKCSQFGEGGAKITKVALLNNKGVIADILSGGEQLDFILEVFIHKAIAKPIFGFIVNDRLGNFLLGINTFIYEYPIPNLNEGIFRVHFNFEMPHFKNGEYTIHTSIAQGDQHNHQQLHWVNDALVFRIHNENIKYKINCLYIQDPEKVKIHLQSDDL